MKNWMLFICILTFFACKKENGKNRYEMTFMFDSGDIVSQSGVIYEKYKKNKKYLAPVDTWARSVMKEEVGLFLKFPNKLIAIKTDNKKIIVNEEWNSSSSEPLVFANNQSGYFEGNIYLEGSYTQKGRAYTVDDGDFEFYWRNAEDFGMTDTILKGKWTLKRK